MIEKIITIISLILIIPSFYLVLRYNLHMFQQNGYKSAEHFKWFRKNFGRQNVLTVFIIPVVFLALFDKVSFDYRFGFKLLVLAVLIFLVFYYNFLRRENSKKKLVFTNRVKRILFTNIVVALLIPFLVAAIGAGFEDLSRFGKYFYLTALIMITAEPYLILLSNFINKPVEKGINQHYINDAKRILNDVSPVVIGVTGSYGKTSVKYFLKTLLEEKYDVLITPESYNTPMGVVRTIREQMKKTNQIFVCEMGARHVGDIKEICDIVHPKHGIITAVGPQHLETFFNIENIKKTKFELADALPDDGMLFLNGDSENIVDFVNENKEKYGKAFFYHVVNNEADDHAADDTEKASAEIISNSYKASDISLSASGTSFTVTSPSGETEHFEMRLVGGYNLTDVLGAISVANQMGISLHDLTVPVRRLRPVEHRMQLIDKGGNVSIIDDAYNSNPAGSKAAVETLSMFDGMHILITPGMVELGHKEYEYNKAFGTYAAANCDYVLLVGERHTKPIKEGLEDAGFPSERIHVFDKLEMAVNFAYRISTEKHKFILLENDLPDNYN